MKIYRVTDRIKVKIHDITIEIAPLSYAQKSEIQSYMLKAAKNDIEAGMKGSKLCMQYAIKSMSGAKNADNSDYELCLENNMLTDDCVDELLNCELSNELIMVCIGILNSIPKKFIDPATGASLEGISIVNPKVAKAKK